MDTEGQDREFTPFLADYCGQRWHLYILSVSAEFRSDRGWGLIADHSTGINDFEVN